MRNKWNTDSLHKIIHLLTDFIFNFMDVAGIDGAEIESLLQKRSGSWHNFNQDNILNTEH